MSASGAHSGWSSPRELDLEWSAAPAPTYPAAGANVTYPQQLAFRWSPVDGAVTYKLRVSTDPDPNSGSLAIADTFGNPIETHGTSYTPQRWLAPDQTYYWSVTPIDAEGHSGTASPVRSFTWLWPSTTTARVTDVAADPALFQPELSWDAVAGAAKYEVQVSNAVDSDGDFPSNAIVLDQTTIATRFAPQHVLLAATNYWRVRAIDPDGHASSIWNAGPSFATPFGTATIQGLGMRTTTDATPIHDLGSDYSTDTPIISWQPMTGASSYEVDVTPYRNGACDWQASTYDTQWIVRTAATSWTPLGNSPAQLPYRASGNSAAADRAVLQPGTSYCVKVSPIGPSPDDFSAQVVGRPTRLTNDPGTGTAFTFSGYPSDPACATRCPYLQSGDYLAPDSGTVQPLTPLFTWSAIPGARSYWVIVAKDPDFTNIVDYAFTRVPAYAPRAGTSGTMVYADNTDHYYWSVLPATGSDGSGAEDDPVYDQNGDPVAHGWFDKRSDAPVQESPIVTAPAISGQPTFHWDPVAGARRYRLQVSTTSSSTGVISGGDVLTDSTAYTSVDTTYPSDKDLYWRVAGISDDLHKQLGWSGWASFRKTLGTPTGFAASPAGQGDDIPEWSWDDVDGAVSYQVEVEQTDGQTPRFDDLNTPAFTVNDMWGIGPFKWRVRAEFPASSGTTDGPWSDWQTWTRTISPPTGLAQVVAPGSISMSWSSKRSAKSYRIEISRSSSFATNIEDQTTETTSYSPQLAASDYADGGTFYWRVAARDSHDTVGSWSPAHSLSLPKRIHVTTNPGWLSKGQTATVSVRTADYAGHAIGGVTLHISGAHVKAFSVRTSSTGRVSFKVRPPRSGTLTIAASKSGCTAATGTISVY